MNFKKTVLSLFGKVLFFLTSVIFLFLFRKIRILNCSYFLRQLSNGLYSKKAIRRLFDRSIVVLTIFALVFQAPLLTYLYAQAPAIVPDGRTQTKVNQTGNVTDIRTNTIKGINAYNSFNRFNVPNGNTTNLHVPDSARNLVNLVHKERSQIDGILNSYKNGQIGGNVFFLNPHGIVVGAGGVINVGSLHLQTPTQQYLKDLISEHGEISAIHEQQLFSGQIPLSPTGTITVKGKINAIDEVQIKAGNVNIDRGASVRVGRQVQVEFSDLVNVKDVNWGNNFAVTPEGKIRIVASNDVEIAGEVKADAVAGNKAGNIEIKSGNDINVREGAEITAKGKSEAQPTSPPPPILT
jgi:filamentous hemagglutinin family protein